MWQTQRVARRRPLAPKAQGDSVKLDCFFCIGDSCKLGETEYSLQIVDPYFLAKALKKCSIRMTMQIISVRRPLQPLPYVLTSSFSQFPSNGIGLCFCLLP